MFGRKKKAAPQPGLIVWNERGETLYDGRLTDFSMREETIKSLSLQFFNDPEPCEIHRSAVLSRVFMELEEALRSGETVDIDDLEAMRAYFSAYPDARRVRLTVG